MTAILGRIGNLVGFTTGRGTTPWDTEMEAALRKMDAMLASTVVAITNTLPGSANEGDLYLVGTSPTGVAAGWANRIARWRSSPAGWEAYQPMQGWIITIVGESTNKVRRYDGTAWVALAADTGAEPYAGVPAQTSFWRSTAAGVRAWVQLVAADITDLATTLAGYLTKTNPSFTGHLYQDGNQRITADGIGRFEQLIVNTLASDNLPTVTDAAGVLRNKSPAEFRTIIAAAPVAHNHFSKLVVSASTSLGGVSASAIYIPTTDVNLTLDGGVDGQGWDIYSTSSVGLVVPSGTSLYAYNGIDTGPKTRPVGGGRAIRIVRLTANIWLVPNMSW